MHTPKFPWPALLALLLLWPGAAAAQEALQDKMTPAEFKAAGLDKLTPAELASLNAWLQGKVSEESRKAATKAAEFVRMNRRTPEWIIAFMADSGSVVSGAMGGGMKLRFMKHSEAGQPGSTVVSLDHPPDRGARHPLMDLPRTARATAKERARCGF